MPAWPAEHHLVATAASGPGGDTAQPGTIDRDETINPGMITKDNLDAAQISQPLLPYTGDEKNVADGRNGAFVQRLYQRQQHGQAAPIITDARGVIAPVTLLDGEVGLRRKHRI